MNVLDVSLKSDLEWSSPPSEDGVYVLDFSFDALDLFDPSTFNAYLLAVESFAKAYPSSTKVIMAKLDGSFSFIRTDGESFEDAQSEMGLPINLVCATLFSDYLHRLASALPEDAVPTIIVETDPSKNLAEMVCLFSKRRFEHFELEFSGGSLPITGSATQILSLPQDHTCDLHELDTLIKQYPNSMCIPEEYLNEHWDEAAEILYDPETIGELGERMLLGFEAAGGAIKKVR